jgi:hypothetical protein
MSLEPLKYNSVSPVLRYNTGLFYGQLLPQEKGKKVMARVSAKLWKLGMLQLLQFLQDLITAATGNPNAPTPNPHLVTLQGLYDDGVDKNNACTAAQNAATAALAERDEHIQAIIAGINAYANSMEAHTMFDAVKLQTLALPLRSATSAPQPCGTVMGLVTSIGDEDGALSGKWDRQTQALSYEVQISPDPTVPNSWVSQVNVGRPRIKVTGLPSGQKRWMRVRAINDLGPGPWSDPSCRMIP